MAIKLRGKRYWGKVRIPKALVASYGGKQHLEKNLKTSDRTEAEVECGLWEAMLRIEWDAKLNGREPESSSLRAIYQRVKGQAESGELVVEIEGADSLQTGIEFEIERIADEVGDGNEPTSLQVAKLAALNDAMKKRQGKQVKKRTEYEPDWSELTSDYMGSWKAGGGKKATNTASQKLATFELFGKFWNGRPVRKITKGDASRFYDNLRGMNPDWACVPSSRNLSWSALQETYGGHHKGLADATMNRHMATLQALWTWAMERDYCEGSNPFSGYTRKLRNGTNSKGYVPWTEQDLKRLWSTPPARQDLREVMLVGMFTGMRLNEIASLTWEQVQVEDGITYFDIQDAKTPAGERRVPVHPELAWLTNRKPDTGKGRLWPNFRGEGAGNKPGGDAGKIFSGYKNKLGYDRTKTFHSFRKNVTGQMERAGVPETAWAQLLGHEKGFTFRVYSPDGLAMEQRYDIIANIQYPFLGPIDRLVEGSAEIG